MDRAALVAHIPSLRRYARALTGDAWAADDLVQDTLERACNKWRLWLMGSDLRAWLFTVMHNVFVNDLRRAHRRVNTTSIEDVPGADIELSGEADTETVIDLQRCISRLPEDQRTVLLLVVMEDFSYQQVAKMTGTPIGTVMSRLSRARARLQVMMQAKSSPEAASQAAAAHSDADATGRVVVAMARKANN
jgi:RNA polymerase sigma factor (sigma-70 family)